MYKEDSEEKEKIHVWLSIVTERRGKNANKNWVSSAPLAWPQLPDHVDGSPFTI